MHANNSIKWPVDISNNSYTARYVHRCKTQESHLKGGLLEHHQKQRTFII
jgi:hypothetical protein